MSIIAAMMLAGAAEPARVRVPMTAAQALAKARAATSIGPDPCRTPVGDDIVVCGRRGSPFSLPLYEPTVSDDGITGREREDQIETIRDATAACHARGEACLKPSPIMCTKQGRVAIGQDCSR